MRELDVLRGEHETILEVMAAVEGEIAAGTLSEPRLRSTLAFIRDFVERVHHGKEEGELFPRLRDDPFLAGLAEVLAEEHREGAAQADAIERALSVDGDAEKAGRELLGYIAFIRGHIRRENEMIFDAVSSRA